MATSHIRICNNIRSRTYPDVQCKSLATQGDFCSKHVKHPIRFNAYRSTPTEPTLTPERARGATRIQRFCRFLLRRNAFYRQGPTVNLLCISENKTDLYSLEPIESIPRLYIWSYKDVNHHFWTFDIRSFTHMMATGLKNPYTQIPLTEGAKEHLAHRLLWLKKKGYMTVFLSDTDLSIDTLFSLRVLDVCMKFDFLGYYTKAEWFLDLDQVAQETLYAAIYELWNYRLSSLTPALKEQIAPNVSALLHYTPARMQGKRTLKWWRTTNIGLFDALVSGASETANRQLGAMYALASLCKVHAETAHTYEWLHTGGSF